MCYSLNVRFQGQRVKHSTALPYCHAITLLWHRVYVCRQAVRYIPWFCLSLPSCNVILFSCLVNWTSFQQECKEFKVFMTVNASCKSLSCGLWHYVAWRRLNYEKEYNMFCSTILIHVKSVVAPESWSVMFWFGICRNFMNLHYEIYIKIVQPIAEWTLRVNFKPDYRLFLEAEAAASAYTWQC